MKKIIRRVLLVSLWILALPFSAWSLPPLAQWNFNAHAGPAAAVGLGHWQLLGNLTQTLASGTGSSDPLGTGDQALSLTGFPAATNVTTTAGIEFSASTEGYHNIAFRFDLRATATACRYVRALYSVDGGNSFAGGPQFTLTNAGDFQNGLVVDLRNFPAAANRSNVRVRLIAETGVSNLWQGVFSKYSPSGTWRLDQVMFTGVPVEPTVNPPSVTPPQIGFTNTISGRSHLGEPTTNIFTELVLRPGESLRITADLDDTNGHPIRVTALPGALPALSAWELPLEPAASTLASFTCTATEADAGQQFLVGLRIDNGATVVRQWSLYVPTATERAMVISEFLADPPAGMPEFVELVNLGSAPLDVSNWTLSDGTSLRHRFPAGSHCPEHGGVVVWAGSAPPPNPVPEATFFKASTSGLSLNNTGDVLQLRNATSNLVERVVYRTMDLGSGSSLTRMAVPDGPFRPHRALSPAPWSVGTAPKGGAWSIAITATQSPSNVRIAPDPSGHLRLEWPLEPGRLARVRRTADLLNAFEVIGENLADGTFLDVSPTTRSFYRVEWQP